MIKSCIVTYDYKTKCMNLQIHRTVQQRIVIPLDVIPLDAIPLNDRCSSNYPYLYNKSWWLWSFCPNFESKRNVKSMIMFFLH